MNAPFGADFTALMKQAQKMQREVARVRESLGEMVAEASAGGGAVTVHVNGLKEVLAVKIRPDAVDPEDVEMLEDLVQSAVNAALKKSQEMADREFRKVTGGLGLPNLF